MTTEDLTGFLSASAGALHNLALSLTGSRSEADDLLQVTLEKVARVWHREIEQPLAYARRVMVRAYISERRRAHWRRERVSAAPELMSVQAAESHQSEDRIVLLQALARLPQRQREAVVLRYLEDMPVGEVAVLMRCSEGNVKRCAFDGLRGLRAALTHYDSPTVGGTP